MSRRAPLALILVYRCIAYPLVLAAFGAVALASPKARRGFAMRWKAPWLGVPERLRPVWFHCASGEFEYAKPVIRRLKELRPDVPVVVTYFSPSVAESAARFPGVDFAYPSPWDDPRSLSRFIERARPRALLFARTDVWPEMAEQARARGVPSLLFSATLTEASGRSSIFARPLARLAFAPLDAIHCVSQADVDAFARLGFAEKCEVAGDARFDQALARLAEPKPVRDELFVDPATTLVAGSTWPEDEGPLLEAARELRGRVKFCLVPHEPTEAHLAELESRARQIGLTTARYSQASAWPEGAVLIVDRVGVLAELYARGRFAFVGGSFRKTVHSVMEPLAAGARTFVGPRHANNREAEDFQKIDAGDLPAVVAVANGAELADAVRRALEAGPESPEEIRAAVRARAGGAVKYAVEWLSSRMD